jgi:DNA-binding CsgD family transcriptional regulator
VIIVGPAGNVLFINRQAKELAAAPGFPLLIGKQLQTLRHDDTARLQACIERASTASDESTENATDVVPISQEHSDSQVYLLVSPVRVQPGAPLAAAVYVSDPTASIDIDEPLLRRLYGLTRTEARVAALLMRGYDVKSISDKRRVTPNTVWTQVRCILQKTNVRRQAELVRLSLSGLAYLHSGRSKTPHRYQ